MLGGGVVLHVGGGVVLHVGGGGGGGVTLLPGASSRRGTTWRGKSTATYPRFVYVVNFVRVLCSHRQPDPPVPN